MQKSNKQFDFVVYGATLEGLLAGYYLHQKGFRTLLLEPSDKVGGFLAAVENSKVSISSLFSSLPDNETSNELLDWVKSHIFSDLKISKKSLPPTTFEKGGFTPFVGFGDSAPKEVDYLQDFLFAARLEIEPNLNDLIKSILASGLEIRYNSTLTSLKIENARVTEITINGKNILTTENLIYAENPVGIIEFFDTENKDAVSQKALARISKASFWSTLQLSMAHKTPVTDKDEIHVLYGTQKNPIVSIGQFCGHTSQWISFISADSTDINEEGVQILKEMKRQIKRAYPEALNDLEFDKIALWPKTHGHVDLKAKSFGQLEGIENIRLCSNHLVPLTNPFLGALNAVKEFAGVIHQEEAQGLETQPKSQEQESHLDA